jgi:hypothetical protein
MLGLNSSYKLERFNKGYAIYLKMYHSDPSNRKLPYGLQASFYSSEKKEIIKELPVPYPLADMMIEKSLTGIFKSNPSEYELRYLGFMRDLTDNIYPSYSTVTNVLHADSKESKTLRLWVNNLINKPWHVSSPMCKLNLFTPEYLHANWNKVSTHSWKEKYQETASDYDRLERFNLDDDMQTISQLTHMSPHALRILAEMENVSSVNYIPTDDFSLPDVQLKSRSLIIRSGIEKNPFFMNAIKGVCIHPMIYLPPQFAVSIIPIYRTSSDDSFSIPELYLDPSETFFPIDNYTKINKTFYIFPEKIKT